MAMHVAGDPESDYNLTYFQYFDYMLTCPLLTLDLLWTLNLPYKVTYSLFVFLTLFSGFIAAGHPQPGKWMWFAYGMVIFAITWLRIVGLVQVRFMQYFAKKEKSMLEQGPAGKRMSISERAGFRKKNVRNPLQFALTVYFTIWIIYPVLWLLVELSMISLIVNHCCTVVMDVLAKSMYGFALLKFQLLIDKSQIEFGELKVTKAELMEEYMEEKKKVRKILKELDEQEMQHKDSDDEDEYNFPAEAASSTGSKKKRRGSQASSPALSHQLPSPQMVPLPMGMPGMPMGMPGMPPQPIFNPAMAGMTTMQPSNSPRMYEPPAGMAQSMPPMMPRPSPTNSGGQGKGNWRSM